VVATEWPAFRELNLATLKDIMTYPLVVDGRNLFDPAEMAEAGFWYYPTGRPPVVPEPASSASLLIEAVEHAAAPVEQPSSTP
jgi:UDPglucose 6-dehydrogenase